MWFFGKRRRAPLQPFNGVGTVLLCDVVSLAEPAFALNPADLCTLINKHLHHVMSIIEKYDGCVIQFVGDAVLGYWQSDGAAQDHAQKALNAAREIVTKSPGASHKRRSVAYTLRVDLGTGEMAGNYFGPNKQFQVIGKAMAIADRLYRFPRTGGGKSSVRMSQFTRDLVQTSDEFVQLGTIPRESLEDLKVLEWMAS